MSVPYNGRYMMRAQRARRSKRWARVKWLHQEHHIRLMLRLRHVYEDHFQPWPRRPMPNEVE